MGIAWGGTGDLPGPGGRSAPLSSAPGDLLTKTLPVIYLHRLLQWFYGLRIVCPCPLAHLIIAILWFWILRQVFSGRVGPLASGSTCALSGSLGPDYFADLDSNG